MGTSAGLLLSHALEVALESLQSLALGCSWIRRGGLGWIGAGMAVQGL